jgi:hypothetical protein
MSTYDSLSQKYPGNSIRDTTTRSVYIGESYGYNFAQNDKMKELESEGYTCICAE